MDEHPLEQILKSHEEVSGVADCTPRPARCAAAQEDRRRRGPLVIQLEVMGFNRCWTAAVARAGGAGSDAAPARPRRTEAEPALRATDGDVHKAVVWILFRRAQALADAISIDQASWRRQPVILPARPPGLKPLCRKSSISSPARRAPHPRPATRLDDPTLMLYVMAAFVVLAEGCAPQAAGPDAVDEVVVEPEFDAERVLRTLPGEEDGGEADLADDVEEKAGRLTAARDPGSSPLTVARSPARSRRTWMSRTTPAGQMQSNWMPRCKSSFPTRWSLCLVRAAICAARIAT